MLVVGSGNPIYHTLFEGYRLKDTLEFLNSLEPEVKQKHRDSIILTLLYYTCADTQEIKDTLKQYVAEVK